MTARNSIEIAEKVQGGIMRCLMFLLLMASPAFAQELDDKAGKQQTQKDYRLGPADVLTVSVVGLKEFTQAQQPWLEIVVSNSGKIHIPFLGVLNVNDMTPSELESQITRRLQERDLVKQPQVTVRVKDYRGHTIYIIGEVMQPGQYYMRDNMYMLDLIGLSLGIPTDGTMYLYRRSPTQTKTKESESDNQPATGETAVAEAIKIDIKALAEGNRPDLNYRLQNGDVLYVPFNRPKYFYATGDLHNPGSFEIPPSRQLLISQAISFAGGPTKTAKMSKGFLVRYDQAGTRQEMAVDFAAILKGKQPDFPVMPNDILFIPGSNAKTLGYGLLNIIPTIATMSLVY
jgi:protein involved in polysaccharide export with SLBB domain